MDWITASEARHISKLPKYQGQRLLARLLKVDISELDEDLRTGAMLDYYYDLMMFLVKRGMPWREVACGMTFAFEFFIAFLKLSLPKSLGVLRELGTVYVENNRIGLENVKKLLKYFTTTVLSHHALYCFVFQQDRECLQYHSHQQVEIAKSPQNLSSAKTKELWDYEAKLMQAKLDEKKRLQDLEKQEELVESKAEEVRKEIDGKISEQEKSERVVMTDVQSLLSSVTADEIHLLAEETGLELKKMQNVAEVAVNLKSIHVPPGAHLIDLKNQSKTQLAKKKSDSRKSSAKSTGSPRRNK